MGKDKLVCSLLFLLWCASVAGLSFVQWKELRRKTQVPFSFRIPDFWSAIVALTPTFVLASYALQDLPNLFLNLLLVIGLGLSQLCGVVFGIMGNKVRPRDSAIDEALVIFTYALIYPIFVWVIMLAVGFIISCLIYLVLSIFFEMSSLSDINPTTSPPGT